MVLGRLLLAAVFSLPAASSAECLTNIPGVLAQIREARSARRKPTALAAVIYASTDRGQLVLVSGDYQNCGNNCAMEWNSTYQCFDMSSPYHISAATRRYYSNHPESGYTPDAIVFWTAFRTCFSGGAFYMPMANEVSGINADSGGGQEIYDNNEFMQTGSSGPLRGAVQMNDWHQCANGFDCRNQPPFDQHFHSIHGVLGQELGHRWGAFVRFRDGASNSTALLGRSYQHWSYYYNSGGSPLEGNQWTELATGGCRFSLTPTVVSRYSPLDQYLMGVRPREEVPAMWFVQGPTPAPNPISMDDYQCSSPFYATNPCTPPESGDTCLTAGTRTSATIDQVIQSEGPRSPTFAASARTYKTAWVLLHKPGEVPSTAESDTLEGIRRFWNLYFYNATDRRMRSISALDGRDELGLWDFAIGPEGWSGQGLAGALGVERGSLIATGQDGQEAALVNENVLIRAAEVKSFKATVRFGQGAGGSWKLTFSPMNVAPTTLTFPVPQGTAARELVVDLTQVPSWSGTVLGLRFTLATQIAGAPTIAVDSIELSAARAYDQDKDGIADGADNCWQVFNDQADSDGDGAGDACDGVVTPVPDAGPTPAPDSGPCTGVCVTQVDGGPQDDGDERLVPRRSYDGGCSCGGGAEGFPVLLALGLLVLRLLRPSTSRSRRERFAQRNRIRN